VHAHASSHFASDAQQRGGSLAVANVKFAGLNKFKSSQKNFSEEEVMNQGQ
jgi:hypothetical protein